MSLVHEKREKWIVMIWSALNLLAMIELSERVRVQCCVAIHFL